MRYYVSGCYNWKWKYNYNYPPLFKDLIKHTPIWDVDMIEKNDENITEKQQLGYVLPENSLNLLVHIPTGSSVTCFLFFLYDSTIP